MTHAAGRLILVLGLSLALVVMTVERLGLSRLPADLTPEFLLETGVSPPWAGLLGEDLRRTLIRHWRDLGPDAAAPRLLQAADAYPLDSQLWMSMARMADEPGGFPEEALVPLLNLGTATAPRSGNTHFDAAQMAMLRADFTAADDHLRSYLAQVPTATRDVVVMARRWHASPEDLVAAILPPVEASYEEAMRMARRERNVDLANALWASKSFAVSLEDRFFLVYIDTLMRVGETRHAAETWRMHDPYFPDGGVPNWNFGRPLGSSRGFNWRQNLPAGARLFRDQSIFQSSPASMRVLFDGTQNLRLAAPSLPIPVEPESRYVLSGYWRGDNLTTRSLPYLWLRTNTPDQNRRVDLPGSTFEWTSWRLEFNTGADTHQIRLLVRRDLAREFDRYLSGVIWIDSIRLERMGPALANERDE